jgi:hypothetical protein
MHTHYEEDRGMKRTVAIVLALAGVVAALAATSAAWAEGPAGKALYRYTGQVTTTSASSVTVTVQQGNRAALQSLLGQSQTQAFTTDAKTVFLKWTNGIPQQVAIGDIGANDYVTVSVRAARDASLDTIRGTPAAAVGDRGQTLVKPDQPLYLFRGTFVGTSGSNVTIDVKGGNHRALKLMIGQDARQSFATGGETVFLHWAERIPTVIDASKLKAGDRIVIRVRAAGDATLQTVETTAAKRVADREPKAQEGSQSAQA